VSADDKGLFFANANGWTWGFLLNASDRIVVITWLWLCDGMPRCQLAAQGVRLFEFDFFEATLSVGLLEREAAFAVAERMVASLVCPLFFSCCFVADFVILVFY
jgi:hypothetical protein